MITFWSLAGLGGLAGLGVGLMLGQPEFALAGAVLGLAWLALAK